MATKAEIKAVAALADGTVRAAEGKMSLEGPHLLTEGLRRGVVLQAFVSEDARDRDALVAAAAKKNVPCEIVRGDDIGRMTDVKTPTGAIGVARRNAPRPLEVLLAAHESLVYFEGVQDPGNVGAIARTAVALGVGAFVFGPGSADPTSPKSLRASAGTLIDAPYARDVDVADLAAAAVRSAHALVLAAVRDGAPHDRLASRRRWILMVANEGAGTRLREDAPGVVRVTIPIAAGVESLNVAAAAAILLDRLRR